MQQSGWPLIESFGIAGLLERSMKHREHPRQPKVIFVGPTNNWTAATCYSDRYFPEQTRGMDFGTNHCDKDYGYSKFKKVLHLIAGG